MAGRPKKIKNEEIKGELNTPVPATQTTGNAMEKLLAKVEELERKDAENEQKLKLLYEVADKGRVFNYESNKAEKKPFKIKLSKFQNGIITSWRTVKDELIKHPSTGLVVGESQEYELLILDNEDKIQKISVHGYPAFSNARYNERIEAEVVSKSEEYNGDITYDVKLDDGRVIKLNARFVN